VKEKTRVLLRTTTSIGEHFLQALDYLAVEEPEAFTVDAKDHADVIRAVGVLRAHAVEQGYIGNPPSPARLTEPEDAQ
jgi:hypothetical protein